MGKIAAAGRGLIVLLQHEGRGNGAAAHIASQPLKRSGIPQNRAYEQLGFSSDARQFDIAAKVLKQFGVASVRLISSNNLKRSTLEKSGIAVEPVTLSNGVAYLGPQMANVADYTIKGDQSPMATSGRRYFVIGDLNVDHVITHQSFRSEGNIASQPPGIPGGTALNAARAFAHEQLQVVLYGQIADDRHGRQLADYLGEQKFASLIHMSEGDAKETGTATVIFTGNVRTMVQLDSELNANDYTLEWIEQATQVAQMGPRDVAFVVAHAFARQGVEHGAAACDA